MIDCGLWLARRRPIAVLPGAASTAYDLRRADRRRATRPRRVPAHAGCEIVTDPLARADLLPAQAARRSIAVWLADNQLVAALLGVAAVRDPARAAARLRLLSAWRAPLRQLETTAPARQLPLV